MLPLKQARFLTWGITSCMPCGMVKGEKKNCQKLISNPCYISSGSSGVCAISPLHEGPEMCVWPAFEMMINVNQRERASVGNHTLTGSLKLPPELTCITSGHSPLASKSHGHVGHKPESYHSLLNLSLEPNHFPPPPFRLSPPDSPLA